jgi:hypothetical protein
MATRRTSGRVTTRRASSRKTRKTSMTRKVANHPATQRTGWIVGTGVVALGVIAAVLLLKEKSASASPASPALPPNPTPGPSGPTPTTPVQIAAQNMAVALQSNGYRMADQSVYQAFQTAAGLNADGFPGTGTMTALGNALKSYGATYPFNDGYTGQPIVVYPWLAAGKGGDSGQYDGVNAPPQAEWCNGSPAGSCP